MRRLPLLKIAFASLALTGGLLFVPLRNEMGNVATFVLLMHLVVGLIIVLPGAVFLLKFWRDWNSLRKVMAMLASVCVIGGVWMIWQGVVGTVVHGDGALWISHVITGFLATGIYVFARKKSVRSSASSPEKEARTPKKSKVTSLSRPLVSNLRLLLLLLPLLGWVTADRLLYAPEAYVRDLTSVTAEGAQSSRFPALIQISEVNSADATLRNWDAQSPQTCSEKGCHPAAHTEWAQSGHATSAINPVYRAALAGFRLERGNRASRWCASCHSPRVALDEEKSKSGNNTAGVDCLSCHAMTETASVRQGNGAYTLQVRETYPFANEAEGWRKRLHHFLMKVRPTPHSNALHIPGFHNKAESCAACHRQSHNVAQNGFQFVQTTDTYGDWRSGLHSGRTIAGAFPLSKTETKTGQECQSCHFPQTSEGNVSHLSAGNRPDNLTQNRVSLDLFALRVADASRPRGEAWIAPLDTSSTSGSASSLLVSGKRVTLDVLVTNESVGHAFPGGYEDLRRAWIEVQIFDEQGRVVAQSGVVKREEDPLPPDTHTYGKLPIDRDGKPLLRHQLARQVSTAWKRVLLPGASELIRFQFQVPGKHWRIVSRFRSQKWTPDIAKSAGLIEGANPITDMARASVTLSDGTILEAQGVPVRPLWERWTRYGLAALSPVDRPDLSRSLYALQTAQTLSPQSAQVALAFGRYYLREPALLAAKAKFEATLKWEPQNAEAQFGLGSVYRRQGQYDLALAQLSPLVLRFSEDTSFRREIALADYYAGRYADAAKSLEAALAVDPDDEQAHYQLQQCYQRLQRIPDARREEMTRRYLTISTWSKSLTDEYRLSHPSEANRWRGLPVYTLGK